jgi:hypothetical protein
MANYTKGTMNKDTVTIGGILCGIAGYAIKTFIAYKFNQGLDNKIGGLEATKAGLKGEFLGTWRHSEEINNIDSQISDLTNRKI